MSADPSAPLQTDTNEIFFDFEEIFFSRTDAHGIIKFGNEVFRRVSGYAWEELLDKPHKIIRHSDMPRAVFWLLWDTIKQGQPIGAFVKNRAKNGGYYWVYAVVTPIEQGYLSVRLRPSSEMLAVVKREYGALASAERAQHLDPATSAKVLLARLGDLGFADYSAFMATALNLELAARGVRIGVRPDPIITTFETLAGTAQRLLTQAQTISEAYLSNETVPFNFRVLAAQLGQDGAAIGVISNNYTLLSEEMRSILALFIEAGTRVHRAINEGSFLASTARIQGEVVDFFAAEAGNGTGAETEMALLDRQQREYRERTVRGLQEIAKTAAGFRQACLEMTRLAAGLEVTRIMGKVECARHASAKDRLDELLADLELFQRTIAQALKEIARMNDQILSSADSLLERTRAAA